MNKQFSFEKYASLAAAGNSCDNARLALIALKNTYVFKPRIIGRIDKAIEEMDVIIKVLLGLMNIEEQDIMSDKE